MVQHFHLWGFTQREQKHWFKRDAKIYVHGSIIYNSHATLLYIDRWMDKEYFFYTLEYYSPIEIEILPFVSTQVDLEGIMLSEMSDRERQILHIFIYMWNLKNKRSKLNKIKTYS